MSKILYIISFMCLSIFTFAQQNINWEEIQYQNSTIYDAVISPVPMTVPHFFVKSEQLITKIEVIDILGKTIFTLTPHYTFGPIEVHLPPCKKGVYFVKITFDDNKYIIKKTIYK